MRRDDRILMATPRGGDPRKDEVLSGHKNSVDMGCS